MSKRVLITGGGKRIGAALVKAFAAEGFEVVIHANTSAAEAEKLRQSLPDAAQHSVTVCDLSDPAARKVWLDTMPAFDLVINNASCYRLTRRGEKEKAADRERYWQVNYLAILEIIEHQKKLLSSGSEAVCINFLDCDVLTPQHGIKAFAEPPPGVDSYLATRIKLAHRLQELAREYAPHLRITAIAPGPVLPPVDCATPGMTVILDKVPLHRPVRVEDITATALYLWHNKSLTGTIVPVDGGMHLGVEKSSKMSFRGDKSNWRVELSTVLLILAAVFCGMGAMVLGNPLAVYIISAVFALAALLTGNIKQKIAAVILLLPLVTTLLGEIL